MQKTGKAEIVQHIAKESGLAPQLVAYQIKQMLEWGIVGEVKPDDDPFKTYYILQPAYYDKNWLNALYAALTPYVEALGKMLDYEQAKVTPEQVTTRNLAMLLRLFEAETEKIGKTD
jgi:hypothetical protein